MTAASFWSLLAPAIEMAEVSGLYGSKGQWAFIPVAVGFTLGAVFVFAADLIIPDCVSIAYQTVLVFFFFFTWAFWFTYI